MTRRRLPRKCRDCGKLLHTPESRQLGYGPKCWRRRHPPTPKIRPVTRDVRPELPDQGDLLDLLTPAVAA